LPIYTASLNDVPLDMTGFEWPIYRGTQPRIQRLLISAARWEEEFANTQFRGNSLSVGQEPMPNERGVSSVTKRYEKVFFLRSARLSANMVEVLIADARYALQSVVIGRTFNVRSGDGYAPSSARSKTDPATLADLKSALDLALKRAQLDVQLDIGSLADTALPDDQLTDGVPAWQALEQMLPALGLDLTVVEDGTLKLIEASADLDKLLNLSGAFAWLDQAPPLAFDPEALDYANRPVNVQAYYYKKREVRVEFNPTGSVDLPAFPKPRLEQVYFYRGEWRNQAECRVAVNDLGVLSNNWPSESDIQKLYFADIWDGTNVGTLQQTPGRTAEAQNKRNIAAEIVAVVKRDWRTAFRVVWPPEFSLEDAPDLAPGSFDDNGEITNQAIRANWVDMLNHPSVIGGKIAPGVSTWDAQFAFGDAPFEVSYDSAASVVALKPSGNTTEIKARIPGRLNKPLTLEIFDGRRLARINSQASNPGSFQDSYVVPSTDNAEFRNDVRIEISFIYTLRLPKTVADYNALAETGGGETGNRVVVELPVPDEPSARYRPDDIDPVNLAALEADAELRSALLLAPYKQPASGIAESPTVGILGEFSEVPEGVSAMVITAGSQGPSYMGVRFELDDVARVIAMRRQAAGLRPTITVNGVTR